MEQSSSDSIITDYHMEVAKIMLELPHLIFQSQSTHRFAFTSWLSKKKRSPRKTVVAAAAPPPSHPSNAETAGPKEKSLTLSPATPLAFSPSESDEKHKPQQSSKRKSHINNLKKNKERLVEIMEDFTRRNELLKKDIETKKRFHDELMAENLELKAKKEKLLETSKSFNPEIELPQSSKETKNSSASYHHHEQQIVNHQALMNDGRTVHKPETNKNYEYPIGRMICWVPGGISKFQQQQQQQQQHDNVGSVGLFDLNVSAEEALFDMESAATKARAAQARFERKRICRSKNFNATYKSRYPF